MNKALTVVKSRRIFLSGGGETSEEREGGKESEGSPTIWGGGKSVEGSLTFFEASRESKFERVTKISD